MRRVVQHHRSPFCASAGLLAQCLPVVACLALLGCSRTIIDGPLEPAETRLAEQVEAVRAGRSNEIRIQRSSVAPQDLSQLEGLEDLLERLNLGRTTFDDETLRRLAKFKKLVQLRLQAPNATDDGIAHLTEMQDLKYLHLMDVPVSDAGLEKLRALPKLESLYLDHAHVSEAGARAYAEARPEVHFHLDGDHPPGDPHDDHHHAEERR